MELKCKVMNYDWGQVGHHSLVANLAAKNDPELIIDQKTPYAEFWMGTHPNAHSVLKNNGNTLQQYIADNPSCLGNSLDIFGADISFLLKVLSVKKALSIQVHPNKEDAKKLHSKFPKVYPDDNHKPELAVALTDFQALCGFRPLKEIADFIKSIPELNRLIKAEYRDEFIKNPSVKSLELCFSSYITSSTIEARKNAEKLIEKFSQPDCRFREAQLADLFMKLNDQFPGDIGLFSIYFLNYLNLKRGEAIFLDAGVPHGYIHGDCVEIMARSDNVVRAGLTPKLRDISTLLEVLEYRPLPAEKIKFESRSVDKFVTKYIPFINDFGLSRIVVPENESYTLPALNCASILITINGLAASENLEIKQGVVLFVPSEHKLTFTVKEPLEIYQAYSNV